jgi:hypothetical protein
MSMKSKLRLTAWVLLVLLVSACSHSAPAPPPPTVKKYLITQGIKYDDVWVSAVRAMTKSLNVSKIDKQQGLIKGGLADWGFREHLTVTVKPEPSAPESYRLEVVSTRSRSVVMRDWEEDILNDLKGMIEKLPNFRASNLRLVAEPLP